MSIFKWSFFNNPLKIIKCFLMCLVNFRYGFHLVRSTYWIVPNPQVTKDLFASLRKDLKFPEKIGKDKVAYVRDLTIGYDNSQPGNKPVRVFLKLCSPEKSIKEAMLFRANRRSLYVGEG